METIRETLEQEELATGIREARSEIAFLCRRLERLVKLQSLLKEKYRSRLESLFIQLSGVERQQWELKSLAKQLERTRERRSVIKEQIASLERHKKTIHEAIMQIKRYEKSSNARAEIIKEEQEILSQRVQDLEHMLELAEKAELDKEEWGIVSQRIHSTKRLLEEREIDLSKRTIDLLFEFYIPPGSQKRFKL
ncbi:MAG: hypothetical protein HXY36_00685 [Chloroflexi bacterium]|nr:hypothetical protein [Chloroflexota bacterium]